MLDEKVIPQYKILIIDDSPEDRRIYCRYLGKEILYNYKIVETETGEEGLEEAIFFKPNLILLDYMLPDCDGLELLEDLKSEIQQLPPIIMLTGQGNETVAVEAMKNGVKDYLIKGKLTAEVLIGSVRNVLQQHHLKKLLTKNIQQQRLIAETALRIRQSLKLSQILDTAVKEVQLLLNCDRVIIYKFAPDMSGDIVAESVKHSWKKSLGQKVIDTCFQYWGAKRYEKGETRAIDDIYKARLSSCHIKLLEEFQVKANVIVPILLASPSAKSNTNSSLWGLFIAHQCGQTRHWEQDEIELLDKLAVQLAIAIQQAELIGNLRNELKTRTKLEIELARRVQVLDASEDYIGLATVKGKVIWQNPRLKQVRGLADSDEERLYVDNYHPEWAKEIILTQGIPTAIEEGSWLGETVLQSQDGDEIPVSQLIIAHKSPQNKVEYISTVMRDLSKQKQTEKSLQERAKQLEWVNKQLLKTTSLLKKRNQELDRFAYVTSHDLKAPLRAIANLATWLKEDLEGEIPEENQEQLELMQSRVKRMDGLIQGLLRYSRAGRKATPVEKVDVGELIRDTIDSLSPPSSIQIAVSSPMPVLETESLPLQQIFSNLIDNAIKYHDSKTGKIVISAKEKELCYEFAVSDDGQGIDPQYHERIFTIFQTLQPRDTFESTGIGLSIVKKIIEDKGGKIWVESQVGEGATFCFTWQK